MNQFYVYIMTTWNNTVLYTGVTNNLKRRVIEHRTKKHEGFTCGYNVKKLVYFERTSDAMTAINREKQIKSWSRRRKIELVETMNPHWEDLSKQWGQ